MLGLVLHRQPNTHTVDAAYVRQQLQERWGITLPQLQLPELRLRPWEDRLGMVVALQQQLRCPSRVYGDTHPDVADAHSAEAAATDAAGVVAHRQRQQQQQQ
jgi:hypothetical protein